MRKLLFFFVRKALSQVAPQQLQQRVPVASPASVGLPVLLVKALPATPSKRQSRLERQL